MYHTVIAKAVSLYAAVPQPSPAQPPGTDKTSTVVNWIAWAVTIACLIGALGAAGKMALEWHRGMGQDTSVGHLGKVVFACIVVVCAAQVINQLVG